MRCFNFTWALIGFVVLIGCDDDTLDPIKIQTEGINITIDENPTVGQVLGTVKGATNRGDLSFSLSDQNPAGAMAINASTGTLTVADPSIFDFETNPTLTATGNVSAEGITETATITITLNDVNESNFITKWKTTSPNESITIPTNQNYRYAYSIDWGDGDVVEGQTGDAIHTYEKEGIYTVKIGGIFPSIRIAYKTDRLKIVSIEQWGNIEWESMEFAFQGCENLEYNATDIPNLSGMTDMDVMFAECYKFNGDIGNWDVGNITSMAEVFWDARTFNQDLSNWNVGNVTNTSNMFGSALVFNQDLSNWDVSNVTNMSSMFSNTSVFNQDLSSWNTEKVVSMHHMFSNTLSFNQPLNQWNISSVTSMWGMFKGATQFNQPLDQWDVSNVTNMLEIFEGASVFNQNLSNWDISSATSVHRMFDDSGLSIQNYDATLHGWSQLNTVPTGLILNSNGLKYCTPGEIARNFLINSKGWTITGDSKGLANDCL